MDENQIKLSNKFYEREKERKAKLALELDMEPLYNWLREITKIDLKFETERFEDRIEFTSQNIVEYAGIMRLNFEELYIDNFGCGICSTAPKYYDKEEIDYNKDYDIYYWVSIHFSYKHVDGGSNGARFANAIYKNGIWEFKLDKDNYKNGVWKI